MPTPCAACPQPLEVWDGAEDNDSCPGSGSVRLSYYAFAFGTVTQCVPTGAGTYRFGYRYKQSSIDASNDDAALCTVSAHTGTACAGNSLSLMQYYSGGPSANWANPSLSTFFTAPSNTGSIAVACQATKLTDVWIDQVYLNSSTGSF
jgi:hypothetical protein